MGKNQIIRAYLPENSIIFDNESYDNSIIGYSTNCNIIYDYRKMIEEYMIQHNCSEEEAIEWIDYNTIRAIPYMPEPKPIVMYGIEI